MSSIGLALLILLAVAFASTLAMLGRYWVRLQKTQRLLESARHQLKAARRKARHLHEKDPVTDLLNHDAIQKLLEEAIGQRSNGKTGVGVFAIREFDRLEQTHGYQLVNTLLKRVALSLSQLDSSIGHLSKGIFAVVFKDAYNLSEAVARAKQVILETSGDYEFPGQRIQAELYGGLSLHPDHAADAQELLHKATVALAKSRSDGAGLTVYESDLELHSRDLVLLSELKSALAMDSLTWFYQPQYRVETRKFAGAEMLVRWIHPKYGVVPPESFIPLAEQTGLISQITLRVIREAVETMTAWRAEGREYRLSINISAHDLESPVRVDNILEQLQEFAPFITLEVTETGIMRNMDSIIKNAEKIRGVGITLSLDDYGTGYSSLAYLKDFNFNEIKIDRRFIKNVTTSNRDLTLTKASIALAHELGATVVAEGVEDRQTARLLVELGCDVLQGYSISEPLTLGQLDDFLAKPVPDLLSPAKNPSENPARMHESKS